MPHQTASRQRATAVRPRTTHRTCRRASRGAFVCSFEERARRLHKTRLLVVNPFFTSPHFLVCVPPGGSAAAAAAAGRVVTLQDGGCLLVCSAALPWSTPWRFPPRQTSIRTRRPCSGSSKKVSCMEGGQLARYCRRDLTRSRFFLCTSICPLLRQVYVECRNCSSSATQSCVQPTRRDGGRKIFSC